MLARPHHSGRHNHAGALRGARVGCCRRRAAASRRLATTWARCRGRAGMLQADDLGLLPAAGLRRLAAQRRPPEHYFSGRSRGSSPAWQDVAAGGSGCYRCWRCWRPRCWQRAAHGGGAQRRARCAAAARASGGLLCAGGAGVHAGGDAAAAAVHPLSRPPSAGDGAGVGHAASGLGRGQPAGRPRAVAARVGGAGGGHRGQQRGAAGAGAADAGLAAGGARRAERGVDAAGAVDGLPFSGALRRLGAAREGRWRGRGRPTGPRW